MSRLIHAAAALALLAAGPAFGQGADPLASLPAEKRAFLADPAMLARFGLTPEKLRVLLAGKSPQDVDAYASALQSVVADAKFHPGVDAGEIVLNPQARGWNAATIVRPKWLDKLARDDGPFSLNRYLFQRTGVGTFAGAPVAIRKEDLVAGQVEVAFIGVPLDLSSGWRDAKHAPEAMRSMEGLIGADADGGVDPGVVLRIADYGDLTVDQMAPERSIDHVRMMVAEVARTGAVPFVVGGDHTIMFPDVAAMADAYGAGTISLVQFDAHAEAEIGSDHFITDKQTLTRLIEQKLVNPANVTQIGLRGRDVDAATVARLKQAGVTMIPMARLAERGWDAIAGDLIKRLRAGPANVFVSFDMSVLDPGLVSGVGRPVPGGMTMREAIPMVRRLCSETKVVGFDLLDAAPILDTSYTSTLSGNYILHACLSGIAMRKTTPALAKRE